MYAVTDVLSQTFPTQLLYPTKIILITAVKIIPAIIRLQVGFVFFDVACHRGVCR
jgi:hypothetical protein